MKSGIINIYKEAGYTSFDVCAKLKGILREKKIGHTGTLDPMAEGVLPVCIGRATKLVGLLTDKPKEYVTQFRLGLKSDTLDITGEPADVLDFSYSEGKMVFSGEGSETICLSEEETADAIKSFEGEMEQLTPMYSARKIDGKRLYEYARAGVEVERKTNRVHIYSINDIEIDAENALVSMRVLCEKGTYIRTLCDDIGKKLGVGAVMTKLLRTKVDVFDIKDSLKLSEVEKARDEGRLDDAVIPPDRIFEALKSLYLKEELLKYVYNGNPLRCDNFSEDFSEDELVRLYDENGNFLALYRLKNGMLRTEILFI